MRVWDIHRRGDRVCMVPDTMAFWGLVFGPLWLLWHRAWLCGLASLLAAMLLAVPAIAATPAARAGGLALLAAIGLFGNDMRRCELRLGGWRRTARVAGASPDHALLRERERADPAA